MAAGATLEREVTEHAYGKLALLADPFGNGFCLLQFTDRGYDAIAPQVGNEGSMLAPSFLGAGVRKTFITIETVVK